jgi:hypothetical protein
LGGASATPCIAWLAISDDEGVTTNLPLAEVRVLAYLARDLSAGWGGKELTLR